MAWFDGIPPGSPAHAIASSTNARVRVVAGPGTGKSFAMKRRVARLLEEDIDPARILPVTFTRVAAEDLHRELVGMGVTGCDKLQGMTLHSLALKMLMRNHVLDATGRTPRPLNDFELHPLISDLMGAHGGKKDVRRRKQAFEAAWARLQHEEPGYVLDKVDAAFQADLLDWLHFHQAMLIGEVIPQIYQYLRDNPSAPERSEFAHILVDEYQDLNKAEQGVIELLSGAADVCIVGDDDQSIYSFKHAHPDGIREWLKSNTAADDLGLADCRRCPTRVVELANSLIAHNKLRPEPRVLLPIAENGAGEVYIKQYPSLAQEVAGVAHLISEVIKQDIPPGDILVLAQRGVIGTPIYEALVAASVPVRSYYAEAELDALDAQRAFALLKLVVNRQDRVALRWLVGIDGSNWHAAGYRRVRAHCEKTGASPWDTLMALKDGALSLGNTQGIVDAFTELVAAIEKLEQLSDLNALVDELFPDGAPATRDLRELALAVIAALDPDDDEPRPSFLRALAEAISQPEIPSEVAEVRIMSLHKSKGLSAPVTIIAGCIDGLLPQQPDKALPIAAQQQSIEEQRRLFYVGITRVKASPAHGKPGTLVLTFSREMDVKDALGAGIKPAQQAYGKATLHASRFIGELGPTAPKALGG
jgi:DNA helicase II / ATP-dependent DNA helicase PcrA